MMVRSKVSENHESFFVPIFLLYVSAAVTTFFENGGWEMVVGGLG